MNIHTEEFKIRLSEPDAELLRAIARRRDIPTAVLARAILVDQLSTLSSVLTGQENGRGAQTPRGPGG